MNRNHLRRAIAAFLVGALVLAACGDDDTDTDDSPDPTQADSDTTAANIDDEVPTTPPDESDEADGDTNTIEVTVRGGEVTGGGRHLVSLGESVTLVVTSDVADHVHLHGYDVMVDVVPGEPAELTFDAAIPGVFEVELEDARLPLLELEIS